MGEPSTSERPRAADRAGRIAFALALPLGAASWLQPDAEGGDLWWHLASGRLLWREGALPRTDPFSHTAAGAPWTNHEWLWDVAAWGVFAVDPDALAWLSLAALALAFACVGVAARRLAGSHAAALAASWLAAAASHWFVDVRPQNLTFLCVALLLATRDAQRAPWLWPPLFLVWANAHAGFVFGLGVVGLDTALRTLAARRSGAPLPASRWIGLAAAAAAAAVNPWGPAIYALPLATLDPDTPFRDLIEWYPGQLGLDPRRWDGRLLWVTVAAASGLPFARRAGLARAGFWVALALVTAAMAFSARRFVPLFALCSAPLAALGLAGCVGMLARRVPQAWRRRGRAAAAALALALLVAWWSDVRLVPHPLQRWTAEESFPAAAVARLRALDPAPAHLLHDYGWGGYLMLHAPGIPVFLDGRAGTVYGDEVARTYLRLVDAAPGWERALEDAGVDAVLLPPRAPLVAALRSDPGWRLDYAEPRAVLWLRTSRATAPADPELPKGERELVAGFRALWRNRLDEAEARLRWAVREDPLQLHAYRGLMLGAARRGDAAAVARWRDAALRADPRGRERIQAFAEAAQRALGDRDAQREALRAMRPRGPFARPEELARVDAALRALDSGSAD